MCRQQSFVFVLIYFIFNLHYFEFLYSSLALAFSTRSKYKRYHIACALGKKRLFLNRQTSLHIIITLLVFKIFLYFNIFNMHDTL